LAENYSFKGMSEVSGIWCKIH